MLICFDYFGLNSNNLRDLIKMFENVIVIDHHLGVLRILDDQINYDNLILYYNEK